MALNSSRIDLVLLFLLLFGLGCEQREDSIREVTSCSSNAVAAVRFPRKRAELGKASLRPVSEAELTPDQISLKKAKAALDDGDVFESMKIARGLIDSADASVRSSIIDIFSWVGRKALPELAELVHDRDPGVAQDAFRVWELALQEIPHDFVKVTAITNLVASIDNPVVIDAALMHIINIDSCYALPALEGLITGYKGKTCGQCAKRSFEHIAGEPWASPERTRMILQQEGDAK